jgi:SAM-dependent methyltransferase
MSLQAAPWATGDDVHSQMLGTVFNYWACQTISAIADLSIADHLAGGSLTAAEVAARENSAPDSTLRLMRAGVAVNLLTEEADGRFASTSLLETLRSDDPRSLRPFVTSMLGDWLPWDHFTAGIRDGSSPFTKARGMEIFEYLAQDPDHAEHFAAAMASFTSVWGPAIADAIDTTDVKCAVDVGGANGTLLQMLQRKNPSLRGIVFDRPNTIEYAEAAIKQNGLTERTSAVGGNFFESVPEGDLYLLKFILHDWSDEDCVRILQNCRKSLTPGGRIAVVDFVVDKANPHAALIDMNMFVATPGRERSLEEFDALFAAAGLKRTALLQTGTPQPVIEVGPMEAD